MRVTIHQPQFLPWLGYLDKIDRADLFIVLDTVQFKKNEWQNRNRIRTADGWQWLTVPVLHHFGQRVQEVTINPTAAWRDQHLRALGMHYARSPFRDRYLPELRAIYAEPWTKLSELNLAVIRWLLEAYGITTPLRCASDMAAREEPTDRLVDLCRAVGATQYLAGPGAEGYMDQSRFEASGVELEIQEFLHPEYGQMYGPFEPNLSAIDLLLCVGPEALKQLRSRRVRPVRATVSARS
ncbi:MAG: WbqC family protein [Nitrospira sp.]|nr:WbqC family protein [Nitrospira sp.]